MTILMDNLLREYLQRVIAADTDINLLLQKRRVKVVSEFNDQPYGHSKKSLQGKQFTVRRAFVDQEGITVWLEGLQCGARLWEDVVLVEETER